MSAAGQRGAAFVAALAAINESRADQPPHIGRHVWRNGAELVWECDDNCPHRVHQEDGPVTETTLPPMALSPDTAKSLRTAGRKVAEWTTERDRLIRQAVTEGGSLREVGAAAGISHTAVKFIAHGRHPTPGEKP